MLTYDQAIEHILGSIEPLPGVEMLLPLCSNRALMQDIVAPISLPSFDNSQMDGYAVISSDTASASTQNPIQLDVVGEVQAGWVTGDNTLSRGQSLRIFTGAVMPKSADAVIPQEDVKVLDTGQIVVTEPVKVGHFLRYVGEDVQAGTHIFSAGKILRASDISLIAALGINEVCVGAELSVGLICTGNELVPPGSCRLQPGQIYNSNESAMLAKFVMDTQLKLFSNLMAVDTEEDIKLKLDEISNTQCDIFIICGGVSVGKYDCVKPAILSMGGTLDFTQVAIRPGKPTVFGSLNGRPFFGLPGNPVSAMVTFELFVRPAILRLAGYPVERCCRPLMDAILTESVSHEPGRRSFVRAKVEFVDASIRVTPGDRQRSDQISGMVAADALLVIPEDVETLQADSKVKVMLLD
jgi:molybdopterin molybdotransferase